MVKKLFTSERWKIEMATAGLLLFSIAFYTMRATEFVVAGAAWATFGQFQMTKTKASLPTKEDAVWFNIYTGFKEVLWILFFLITETYTGLASSIVFTTYWLLGEFREK